MVDVNLATVAPSWIAISTTVMTAIGSGGIGVVITKYWDHTRRKRAQTDDVALSLVDKLNHRISGLESEVAREREHCAGRIEKLELHAEEDRKTNEALDMLRRHQVANSKSVLHMTIDLIEVAPDRLEQIIPRIRKRLEEHDAIEARDKAAFMAARFGGIPPVLEENAA